MVFILRPKGGPLWTNQLVIPRVERPPIPRLPSVHEKIEGRSGNYEFIACPRSPALHRLYMPNQGALVFVLASNIPCVNWKANIVSTCNVG